MFAGLHFAFELIKITILSTVYAGILILLIKVLKGQKRIKSKFLKFFKVIYLFLFIFMFTYYGDHGLGDESRIPIGHWEEITASDGYPYFRPKDFKMELALDKFLVKDDVLYAQTLSSDMTYAGYIINDLKTDSLTKFKDKTAYKAFASKTNLPLPIEFQDFYKNYSDYWNGWRFWLLP